MVQVQCNRCRFPAVLQRTRVACQPRAGRTRGSKVARAFVDLAWLFRHYDVSIDLCWRSRSKHPAVGVKTPLSRPTKGDLFKGGRIIILDGKLTSAGAGLAIYATRLSAKHVRCGLLSHVNSLPVIRSLSNEFQRWESGNCGGASVKTASLLFVSAMLCLTQSVRADSGLVALREKALTDQTAWQFLESLTTEIGPRQVGSPAFALAKDFALAWLTRLGFQNVHAEPFHFMAWRRGVESASIVGPQPQHLVVIGLGEAYRHRRTVSRPTLSCSRPMKTC